MKQKIVFLMLAFVLAVSPLVTASPFNIWTKPDADWLTGQTPNFDPAWAWMKWMDANCGVISGRAWYVDSDQTDDTGDGQSWERAKQYIQSGIDLCDDGDTVYVRGLTMFSEAVTTGTDLDNVKLIGVSSSKVNPTWTSTLNTTSALVIAGPNWQISNFRFYGAAKTAPFIVVQYTAGGTVINGNLFQGGGGSRSAIQYYGAPVQCKLINNHFTAFGGLMAADIATVWGNYGEVSANDYEILGNWFTNNTDHIDLASCNCLYQGNHFNADGEASDAATIIDTYGTGEDTGFNTIVGNYFGDTSTDMTVANGYTFTSTDTIVGNYCIDGVYPRTGVESNNWYVDSAVGNDFNSGRSWGQSFITITAAEAAASSYDTIYIQGSFTESVEVASTKINLSFIGAESGLSKPVWFSDAVGDEALTIAGKNGLVKNIMFMGNSQEVPLVLIDGTAAGAGNGFTIEDCYFHGNGTCHSAICFQGGVLMGRILNNRFCSFAGQAHAANEATVYGTNYVQAACDFEIIGNTFFENTDHLVINGLGCTIKDNVFMKTGHGINTTTVINTHWGGGGEAGNAVTGNTFENLTYQIDNAHGYYGAPGDAWVGNFCPDGMTTEEYPRAGTANIEQDGIVPTVHLTTTVTANFSGAAYETGDSPVTIFTVTGDVLVRAFGVVKTACTSTGTNGTLELGVAGATTVLLVQDAVDGTAFDTGFTWTKTTACSDDNVALLDAEWILLGNGPDIILTIATNSMTAGIIQFGLQWIPMSANAEVVGAAP